MQLYGFSFSAFKAPSPFDWLQSLTHKDTNRPHIERTPLNETTSIPPLPYRSMILLQSSQYLVSPENIYVIIIRFNDYLKRKLLSKQCPKCKRRQKVAYERDSSRRSWITWANAIMHIWWRRRRPRSFCFALLLSSVGTAFLFLFSLSRPWQIFVLLLASQRHFKKMFYITKADASPVYLHNICTMCIFSSWIICYKTPMALFAERKTVFYVFFVKREEKEN